MFILVVTAPVSKLEVLFVHVWKNLYIPSKSVLYLKVVCFMIMTRYPTL